jgi:hypothetical protein
LDAVIWNENVQVPFGATPKPLPQDTNVVPASRDAVFWVTEVRIEIPERADPGFWRVIVYGTLGPSRVTSVGVVELRLELRPRLGGGGGACDWRSVSGATTGCCVSTAPFASTTFSTRLAELLASSVPDPADVLVAAIWNETVHVPFGTTPGGVTAPPAGGVQVTNALPASRAPVAWMTEVRIEIPERLDPLFWRVIVYGTLGPSRTTGVGVVELRLRPLTVTRGWM